MFACVRKLARHRQANNTDTDSVTQWDKDKNAHAHTATSSRTASDTPTSTRMSSNTRSWSPSATRAVSSSLRLKHRLAQGRLQRFKLELEHPRSQSVTARPTSATPMHVFKHSFGDLNPITDSNSNQLAHTRTTSQTPSETRTPSDTASHPNLEQAHKHQPRGKA